MHFANSFLKQIVFEQSGYYIYILLTDYPDRVSKSIKRLGFWKYSHVSVSTSLIDSDFYSYVGKKGFRIEQPAEHPTFRGLPVSCALYAIPVTKEVCESATKQLALHTAVAGSYRYSYFGLVLAYFGIRHRLRNQHTCTSFVSETLHKSGAIKKKLFRHLASPENFRKKFRKHLIYKGTIKDMLKKSGMSSPLI
ncbi:MAG: hypothetical protein IK085_11190 [Clostridia bacterium]|nr:hypothetical protein [Clostridia bacterium]